MGIREIQIGDQKLRIHEPDQVCDSVTGRAFTGSWLWDSALLLSQWQAASHLNFQGQSVLELGAGAGLPGLTAAKICGASRVVLTDVAPLVSGLVKNIEANALGDRVEAREHVWGSDESLNELGEFDVVLMSDVFFDTEEMGALGRTLKGVCGKGTRVWGATELRFWTGECLTELVSQGFGVAQVPSGLGGDDVFAVYELIPPGEEHCHVEA